MRCLPILLICPFMTGCLAYAYPRVNVTPAVIVNEPDVRAFRVTEDSTRRYVGDCAEGSLTIEEIRAENGVIPSQLDSYIAYLAMAFPFARYNDREVSVRLYRRGYETVVVSPNRWLTSIGSSERLAVTWKKAESLDAREKAIRDLHFPHSFRLMPPVKSAFIAGDLLELANSPLAASVELAPQRLRQKAQKFIDGERTNRGE